MDSQGEDIFLKLGALKRVQKLFEVIKITLKFHICTWEIFIMIPEGGGIFTSLSLIPCELLLMTNKLIKTLLLGLISFSLISLTGIQPTVQVT